MPLNVSFLSCVIVCDCSLIREFHLHHFIINNTMYNKSKISSQNSKGYSKFETRKYHQEFQVITYDSHSKKCKDLCWRSNKQDGENKRDQNLEIENTLQQNLSIADMLYSGHLFIADTFSRNYLSLAIVKPLYFEPLYSGHFSIADTFSENQWCPLLRGFTVF